MNSRVSSMKNTDGVKKCSLKKSKVHKTEKIESKSRAEQKFKMFSSPLAISPEQQKATSMFAFSIKNIFVLQVSQTNDFLSFSDASLWNSRQKFIKNCYLLKHPYQLATQKIFYSLLKFIYSLPTILLGEMQSFRWLLMWWMAAMKGFHDVLLWAGEENFIAASKTWNFPISNSRFSFDLMDE